MPICSGPFTKKKTPGDKPGVAIRDVGKELVGLVEPSLGRTAFVDPTSDTAKIIEHLIFSEGVKSLSFTQCISGRMRIPRMAAKTLCACRILIQAKGVHVLNLDSKMVSAYRVLWAPTGSSAHQFNQRDSSQPIPVTEREMEQYLKSTYGAAKS